MDINLSGGERGALRPVIARALRLAPSPNLSRRSLLEAFPDSPSASGVLRVAENLIAKGFNAKALKGGWKEWSEANYPVEKK